MVIAACVGVVQLHVVGSLTRSVRLGLVLACVPAGMYGATSLALGLQLGMAHLLAAIEGTPAIAQVDRVGYSAGPVIEEVVKVAPLVVAGLLLRTRRQWGLTDHVLLGAALGSGFGLMEALLRYSAIAIVGPVRTPTGWVVPVGFIAPFVPDASTSLGSWLPAPASSDPAAVIPTAALTSQHLVWSAVAGLGVGVLLRASWRSGPGTETPWW